MIKIKVHNQKGDVVSEKELSDKVFGLKVSMPLIHQAYVAQTANARQVIAHTKDRSEVRGGGKKPWRQKGTGRARAGSSRSPLWIGGGVTFGPLKNRNFKKNINKAMKRKALCMALSDKVAGNNLVVVDELKIEGYKTKDFNGIVTALEEKALIPGAEANAKKNKNKAKRNILIINDKKDEKVVHSCRNLAGIGILNLDNINLADLLKHKHLVTTLLAIKKLEERYK